MQPGAWRIVSYSVFKACSVFIGVLTMAAGAICVPQAAAEKYALLIGASRYASLPESRHLKGPANDVAITWNMLTENGFSRKNIHVLADHLEERKVRSDVVANGLPTRRNILTALKALAGKVGKDDFVYIHFSGHGAMQPDNNGDEADNLDEIFLPVDIGKWEAEIQAVRNAVVDDELRVLLSSITATGARLWVVFDQCNAGTATRGAQDDVRTRAVAPEMLGIPAGAMPRTRGTGAPPGGEKQDELSTAAGSMIAFYAVHPGESALERRMPDGARRAFPAGVMTFSLVSALRSGKAVSYRDLALAIQRAYASMRIPATPLFEGDLDQLVFGQGPAPRRLIAEFTGDDLILRAGLLDGVREGTTLALFPLGGGSGAAPLLRVVASDVTYTSATLDIVREKGGAEPDPDELPDMLEARVISSPVRLSMKVALPAGNPPPLVARALAMLRNGPGRDGVALEFVQPGREADYHLAVEGGKLFFFKDTQTQAGPRPVAPAVDLARHGDARTLSGAIGAALQRLARARNLFALANAFGARANLSDALKITPYHYREAQARALRDPQGPPDNRRCERFRFSKVKRAMKRTSASAPLQAGHCDILVFELVNGGDRPIDVTGLYVDSAGGIMRLAGGNAVRLEPNAAPAYMYVRIGTWDWRNNRPLTIGLENVVFIAVERAKRSPELASFVFLEQPALPLAQKVRGGERGAGSALVRTLMSAVYPQGRTRAALDMAGDVERAEIRSFAVRVTPPRENRP